MHWAQRCQAYLLISFAENGDLETSGCPFKLAVINVTQHTCYLMTGTVVIHG